MKYDVFLSIDELKVSVEYETSQKKSMENRLLKYYLALNSLHETNPHHTMHMIHSALHNEHRLLLHLPLAGQDIDSICLHGDNMQYTLINSAKPKINTNFALCRAFCYYMDEASKNPEANIRPYFSIQNYSTDNLVTSSYARMLIMPEGLFRDMYIRFLGEQQAEDTMLTILVKLMNYFEVPYYPVLIRCCSLHLLDSGEHLEELLSVDYNRILTEFQRLWLDESILQPTGRDDFNRFEQYVRTVGEQYLQEEYINSRTLTLALRNIKSLYSKIREG